MPAALVFLFAAQPASAFTWTQPTCPTDPVFGPKVPGLGISGGRGPSSGPYQWFVGPRSQPPIADNPLSGRQWFVDCQWGEAWIASRVRRNSSGKIVGRQTERNSKLFTSLIARQPIAKWIGPIKRPPPTPNQVCNSRPGDSPMYCTVSEYLQRSAQQAPGALRFIVFHKVPAGQCPGYKPPNQSLYGPKQFAEWVDDFARGVRDNPGPLAIVIEPDSMPRLHCTPRKWREIRIAQLSYAVDVFSQLPQATVYLDAGASDWIGWRTMASYLKRVGVQKIRGFSLNVTHYDWTRDNIAYGSLIAKRLDTHFVVSTGRAGGGNITQKLRDQGYLGACNIPNAGLGPAPTVQTGVPRLDAFVWLVNPGLSDGRCVGGNGKNFRTEGVEWADQLALNLIGRRCQSGSRCLGPRKVTYNG